MYAIDFVASSSEKPLFLQWHRWIGDLFYRTHLTTSILHFPRKSSEDRNYTETHRNAGCGYYIFPNGASIPWRTQYWSHISRHKHRRTFNIAFYHVTLRTFLLQLLVSFYQSRIGIAKHLYTPANFKLSFVDFSKSFSFWHWLDQPKQRFIMCVNSANRNKLTQRALVLCMATLPAPTNYFIAFRDAVNKRFRANTQTHFVWLIQATQRKWSSTKANKSRGKENYRVTEISGKIPKTCEYMEGEENATEIKCRCNTVSINLDNALK